MKTIPIQYIEFQANDLSAIKDFYSTIFGWSFTDYGPTYTAFSHSGVEGGFEKSQNPIINGALIILYAQDLEAVQKKVIAAGGSISKDIFSFPGGKRFHFTDPSGNELAVWSDKK
jgi:predicted enzyme related to lactoylglutathione lyase